MCCGVRLALTQYMIEGNWPTCKCGTSTMSCSNLYSRSGTPRGLEGDAFENLNYNAITIDWL
jgi:hypothetical protein